MTKPFQIDSRLVNDTVKLGESQLNLLLLFNDKRYPWCLLVPKVANATEIFQLSAAQQQQLIIESSQLSKTFAETFAPDKINIGALGNIVSQLHLHHIARYKNDPAWPGPVWGHSPAIAYTADELTTIKEKLLNSSLQQTFNFSNNL